MDRQSLGTELDRLKRGRGVLADDLNARLGPALRAACEVHSDDQRNVVRRKIIQRLTIGAAALPEDLRTAVLAALALHPDAAARGRFLQDRVSWVGGQLSRDVRTVRRYVDDGLGLLADALVDGVASQPSCGSTSAAAPTGTWRVESFGAMCRLDRPTFEAYEQRRVAVLDAPLDALEAAISVAKPDDERSPLDVRMELLYGGRLGAARPVGERHVRWTIELPATVPVGGVVDFALHYVMPTGLRMGPHYVFVPLHSCRQFRLVVKFDPDQVPPAVHRIDGLPPRLLDDRAPIGELVAPDRFGELVLHFTDLRQGLAYGARWQPAGQPPSPSPRR